MKPSVKVMYDLNILLDVLQNRQAFYQHSAAALGMALKGQCSGLFPGHALTTIHYLLTRYADRDAANQAVDFILDHLQVCDADHQLFKQARSYPMKDFEDAVVASLASHNGCQWIVTRNIRDFAASPVDALLPEEFLGRMCADG